MKKIFIAIIIILAFLVATSVQSLAGHKAPKAPKAPDTAEAEIYGCVNKHGKLRMYYSKKDKCKRKEEKITFGGGDSDDLNEVLGRIESLEILVSRLSRFKDMEDGTVRDNETGLRWLKDASCSEIDGYNLAGGVNWTTANNAVAALAEGYCSLEDGSATSDWRLPTTVEWEAFLSHVYNNPALVNTVGDAQWSEGDAFVGVISDYYWAREDIIFSDNAKAMNVDTGDMSVHAQANEYYVWPVRSGN